MHIDSNIPAFLALFGYSGKVFAGRKSRLLSLSMPLHPTPLLHFFAKPTIMAPKGSTHKRQQKPITATPPAPTIPLPLQQRLLDIFSRTLLASPFSDSSSSS